MFGKLYSFVLSILGREAHKRAPELTELAAGEVIRHSLESMEVSPRIKEIAEMDLKKVNGNGLGSSPSDRIVVSPEDEWRILL